MTCDGAGSTNELETVPSSRASVTGADIAWKQLVRQDPILGQDFSGQCGHDFIGLWQGIWCSVEPVAGAAIASTIDVVVGTITSAPSIARTPRTEKQRWYIGCLTRLGCHSNPNPATSPGAPPFKQLKGFGPQQLHQVKAHQKGRRVARRGKHAQLTRNAAHPFWCEGYGSSTGHCSRFRPNPA